ncbi:MAG TPA: aromatic-ring-hydroxylating dioxygenase subunit beta [Steroidobacteraceae bacterium]|nr:aromatic-ring-hydroxylating dioxygenase subunit beta [Steroidobacteraceae bacterium]
MSAAADLATLTQFVYDEARLIDEKRFEEWYELFTDDAYYWMPLTRGQPDGDNHTSLLYEDKLLLRVRIDRLKNPHSFSQQPPSFCQHVLQAPQLESANRDGAGWVMRTPFLYLESQLDTQQLLAGISRLHLVQLDGRLRIRLKKVELLNCDAALPSIQLFP